MAAYAHHAMVLGYTDEEVNRFFAKALFAIGEDWGMEELLPIVMEVGEKNLKCMALLDKANTENYGTPTPVTVPLTVERGRSSSSPDMTSTISSSFWSRPRARTSTSTLTAKCFPLTAILS